MIATATAFDLRFRLDTVPDIYGQNPKTALERHREHGKIVKALKARDGKVAEELMRSHIIGANDALLQALAARESD
jgi:DNA-binding GntR family transcriptional regulator